MKKDYLLEIGCENLPSGYIEAALGQLEASFSTGLESERIGYGAIDVTGTPNRLVVHVEGLSDKQEAATETVTGPPVSVAVTPDGEYTKAATGFAASQGVEAGRLKKVDTERGEYLAVIKKIKGRSTGEILREKVPRWITGIRFPKVMKWDSSDLRFARPVRWIMSFYGDRPLPMEIGSLSSIAKTRLSPYFEEFVEVKGIKDYYSVLEKSRIVLDHRKRKEKVESLAVREAVKTGGRLVADDELCSMVANLVEAPVVMAGEFDESFLELPREVVVTALKSHQRYFSVEDEEGKLLPKFIAFADGVRRNRKEIVRGYERVLQARLADARFYFGEDTVHPLEDMAGKLGGIVWLEGLGTLAQKTERMEKLCDSIVDQLPGVRDSLREDLLRTARLAKADLASEMVKDGKEFTLLQGYIGREYARLSGEGPEVSEAIYEHYFPRFAGDRLPNGEPGLILSIADRIDTICGCFIQGLEPTGSQDPYALRRNAVSVLRILIDRRLPVSLPGIISTSLQLFAEEGLDDDETSSEATGGKIMDFFIQRFMTMLKAGGTDHDLGMAALTSPWRHPLAVVDIAGKLQDMRRGGTLAPFVLAMKRITNILPKDRRSRITSETGLHSLRGLASGDETGLGFKSSLFIEDAEKVFFEETKKTAAELLALDLTLQAGESLDVLVSLVPHINEYFDRVLVNCEDAKVRENRLSFLSVLFNAFGSLCNYSEISGEQG